MKAYLFTTSLCSVTIFAGCGGSQPSTAVPAALNDKGDSLPYHKTFHYSGKRHSFIVPLGVTKIDVVARGGAGRGGSGDFGRGGRVHAVIAVRSGETLYVFVGGQGGFTTGGFNGGGSPGTSTSFSYGYGGGGASDVREGGHVLSNRILVAAGGGGQGCCQHKGSAGGKGGPEVGEAGENAYYGADGGGGGTQSQGGAGGLGKDSGQDGFAGGLGYGGRGGNVFVYEYCNSSNYTCDGGGGGGGGGGGYYGGGGGAGGLDYYSNGNPGAGAGGGSSYVEPSAIKVHLWRGWKGATGNGLVVFSWK